MAKLTTLEIFNAVMINCGESEVENLNNLSGVQNVAWNKIIEALGEVYPDQNTRYQFLEAEGKIPLVTGNYKYQISALTSGSDMQVEDIESFLAKGYGRRIDYITPQEFDKKYPYGIAGQITGLPTKYTKYAGYIVFNAEATTSENAKEITFRYWKYPTLPATSSPNVTLDLPEPYDRTLLVSLATMKVLSYLGNEEAATYKMQVYGDGRDVEGTLNTLKANYSSPILKPRVTYKF